MTKCEPALFRHVATSFSITSIACFSLKENMNLTYWYTDFAHH